MSRSLAVALIVGGAGALAIGVGVTALLRPGHRSSPSIPAATTPAIVVQRSASPSASLTVPTSLPTLPAPATPAPPRTANVLRETQVDANTRATRCTDDFEPIAATHPTDPGRIAVAYQRYVLRADGGCHLDPVIAISHDQGRTWNIARGRPWAGSGRYPDHHSTVAWGPGPTPGRARLYWADATVGSSGSDHRASVAWSDDEGRTWSRLYVERRTPPWVGGFPDITVDRNPASPDYGAVYVAYNWLADPTRGPGLRLLASTDFGRTWRAVEIPPAAAPSGFGDTWRIAYRVRTGPDGAAYVSWYQADLRVWDRHHIFPKGGEANVGRLGFAVARVMLHRSTRTFTRGPSVIAAILQRNVYTVRGLPAPGTTDNVYVDPAWCQGFDVDPATGRVFLAVGDYRPRDDPDVPRGSIRVARSDDGGRTWRWVTIPALPAIGGHPQSSYKPSLVVAGAAVVVGFRGMTDVPAGTSPSRELPTIGAAFSVSYDGGVTFSPPILATRSRWNAAALESTVTGPGLRERAERTADGRVVYAYGDGRLARAAPNPSAGRSAVFAALLTHS